MARLLRLRLRKAPYDGARIEEGKEMSITGIGSHAGWAGYALSRSGAPAAAPDDAVEQEFLDYAQMSPAEKIRYAWLAAHDLSEDDLKSMSAEQRAAVEAAIREEIRKAVAAAVERKSGRLADIRA